MAKGRRAAAGSGDAPARPRRLVGLRWKSFAILLLLLGAAHAALGYLNLRTLNERHERVVAERFGLAGAQLSQTLAQASDQLGRLASQLGATVSAANPGSEGAPLAAELQATLSRLAYYDPRGTLLRADIDPAVDSQIDLQDAIRTAARTHRPFSALSCAQTCEHHLAVPAFDQEGDEIVVVISEPVGEVLLTFSRDAGLDIGLLPGPAAETPDWMNAIRVLTNAPTLMPSLAQYAAQQPFPPRAGTTRARARDHAYRIQSQAVSHASLTGPILALLVYDERADLQQIARELASGVGITLVALLLSAMALFLLIGAATRRLDGVTSSLGLLAERRFDEARSALRGTARSRYLPDEVDVLGATTRWLTDRLQRLDTAEAANEAKTRFLAVMSHEIRTPMNGVLGMLELLDRTRLNAEQHDAVRVIRESAEMLLAVLNDILDLSRIEAGRIDLEQVPVSIEDLVDGVMETVAVMARDKPVRLMAEVSPEVPRRVLGDPTRLRQVLFNLCSNAVKFTEAGRVVVRVSAEPQGAGMRLHFAVSDTGIGIPDEVAGNLFRPFTQAESSTTRRFGGSGLGLSICRGLVERMGGRIGFDSAVGRGSTFRFSVPLPPADGDDDAPPFGVPVQVRVELEDEEERRIVVASLRAAGAVALDSDQPWNEAGVRLRLAEAGADAAAPPSRRPLQVSRVDAGGAAELDVARPVSRRRLLRRIAELTGQRPAPPRESARKPITQLRGTVLVAEDHPTNQLVIRHQLALIGLEVDIAADGAMALDMIKLRHYDALITDLHMPRLDGLGLTREVRSLERAGRLRGRLPIIAMTADVFDSVSKNCRDAGMDDVIGKPVAIDVLSRHLLRWLDPQAAGTASAAEPAEASPAAPPMDIRVLHDLVGDDPVVIQGLLEDFQRSNDDLPAQMRLLLGKGDYDALRAAVHRFIGSARTLGANALGAALESLQLAARRSDTTASAAALDEVDAAYARLRSYLLSGAVVGGGREPTQPGNSEGGSGRDR